MVGNQEIFGHESDLVWTWKEFKAEYIQRAFVDYFEEHVNGVLLTHYPG